MPMISTLIALPYELTRLPLSMIDQRVSARLPETSTARVTIDHAMGTTDKIAGTILHNDSIIRRGTTRLERSDKHPRPPAPTTSGTR